MRLHIVVFGWERQNALPRSLATKGFSGSTTDVIGTTSAAVGILQENLKDVVRLLQHPLPDTRLQTLNRADINRAAQNQLEFIL